MTKYAVYVFLLASAFGQSIAVSSPTANQSVSGFSGFSFTVTPTSLPTLARVCYTTDAYPATNPGQGPLPTMGCSTTAPFSLPWNTNEVLSGPRIVSATAYDAKATVLATSPAVAFTVANTWPVTCTDGSAPAMTVSPATAVTSPWSGVVNITVTVTGSCSTDQKYFYFYLDGVLQEQSTSSTAAVHVGHLSTLGVLNGQHVVAVIGNDSTNGITYSAGGGQQTAGLEWSRVITITNSVVPVELRNNAHDIYNSAGNTFTLGCNLINSDASVVSSPTCDYYSQNTAVATVTPTTGVVTMVANGNANIRTMAETSSGSCNDLSIGPGGNTNVQSTLCPFDNSDNGQFIKITAGPCTPGIYEIKSIAPGNTPPVAALVTSPGTLGLTGCTFTTGPSRTSWIFVNPTNIMPHFGSDGTILTSYDPTRSVIYSELVANDDGFSDQPYSPGFAFDLQNSAYNLYEYGALYDVLDAQTSGTQTSFQTNQTNYIQSILDKTTGYSKWFWGSGDNFMRAPSNLYASTRGPASPLGGWTTPAVTYAFQTLKNTGRWFGISMLDEYAYAFHPLQGPIKLGSTTTQSWLNTITSNGTVCTANTGPVWDLSQNYMAISGATTAGFNSVGGASFHVTGGNLSGSFTWPCTVAAGTYNSTTDPNLTIEPLTTSYVNAGDYIHYDAMASLVSQANAVSGRALICAPPAAGAVQNNWVATGMFNSGQSIGAVTKFCDYADLYTTHISENYLPLRNSSNSIIGPQNQNSIGQQIRSIYGGFDPGAPISVITQSTPNNIGWQGYNVPVASCTNDLCTFSSPHGIANVIPGITRLAIAGSSNSAYNTQFYAFSVPTPTTMKIDLAATTVTCTGACGIASTGTLNFQNGDTLGLAQIWATGLVDAIGDFSSTFLYSGSPTDTVNAHRGQTFTLTGMAGPQAAYYGSHTFRYRPENLIHATDTNGTARAWGNYRELPQGSTTGGTATIIADNNFVQGRNGSEVLNNIITPAFAAKSIYELMNVRAAMQRLYKSTSNLQGYRGAVSTIGSATLKAGWQGFNNQQSIYSNFGTGSKNYVNGQMFAHPHWESGNVAPVFHGNNMATLWWNGVSKFYLQPALNAPDYGQYISCGANGGANGNILHCWNASETIQTRTFQIGTYFPSGAIAREVANWYGITITILSGGTTTDTLTLGVDDAVAYFPASGLSQPPVSVRLADVPNATKVLIRWAYDPYWLDAATSMVFDCGTGTCTPPWDRNIGKIWWYPIYLDTTGKVLSNPTALGASSF